jgi:hypothetical protein
MLWFFLSLVLLALAGGFVIPWAIKFVAVDRCLDSGGAYDYELKKCITSYAVDSESG